MKKIGILTFHYTNNYGGVLQAVSLYNYLKNEGYDVEIINYRPKLKRNLVKQKLREIRNFLYGERDLRKKKKTQKKFKKIVEEKFNEFRKENAKLSPLYYQHQLIENINKYDYIILGSDQIWNPSQRKSPVYFADFDEFRGKIISYAADSSSEYVNLEEINDLKRKLGKMDSISVRNFHSRKFVKQVLDYEPVITLDPTLLFEVESKSNDSRFNEDYVFTYVLGSDIKGGNQELMKLIKEHYPNTKTFSGVSIDGIKFHKFNTEYIFDIGPHEWMEAIKKASFVLTDSFHGVLYSIKYEIPFLAYFSEPLRAGRFLYLIEHYGLEGLIVDDISKVKLKTDEEYKKIFKQIKSQLVEERKTSQEYLKKALK